MLAYRSYFEPTKEIRSGITIPMWIFPVIAALSVVLFIVWFFARAPWLAVKNITIEGQATAATREEIEKLRGKNILWLSVTNPEKIIRQHQPSVKQIQILRGIPDTLRVKLIEREPVIIWQLGETWFTIDPTGFVFHEQQISKRPDGTLEYPGTNVPVVVDTKGLPVQVGTMIARGQFVQFIRTLKERLPKDYGIELVRAEVGETTFNVTAVTSAGWNILFDTTRTVETQLKTLTRVLESKRPEIHEYVDVRVRGWVYYK